MAFAAVLQDQPSEVFAILCLSTKHRVIGYHEVSRGTLDTALVHPREVFKAAILANAAAIILTHNHPSGDPTPSADDVALTQRLVQAGSAPRRRRSGSHRHRRRDVGQLHGARSHPTRRVASAHLDWRADPAVMSSRYPGPPHGLGSGFVDYSFHLLRSIA